MFENVWIKFACILYILCKIKIAPPTPTTRKSLGLVVKIENCYPPTPTTRKSLGLVVKIENCNPPHPPRENLVVSW